MVKKGSNPQVPNKLQVATLHYTSLTPQGPASYIHSATNQTIANRNLSWFHSFLSALRVYCAFIRCNHTPKQKQNFERGISFCDPHRDKLIPSGGPLHRDDKSLSARWNSSGHTHLHTYTSLAYKFLWNSLQVVLSTDEVFPTITPARPFHLICFVY